MTKAAALHEFFSSFGITAYKETAVPDDVVFPYLTYQGNTGTYDGMIVPITVNLWYYTDSEAIPNAKAEEISKAISYTGKIIPCDDGIIWITRGSPFSVSQTDETNPTIKLRSINLNLRYLTE